MGRRRPQLHAGRHGSCGELARRRAEEVVEPRARRRPLVHSRRGRTPLHDVPAARPAVGRAGAARKKSSPRSMPPAARRSGSSGIPRRPTASISRKALVRTRRRSSSATGCYATSTPQGAVRARQGDRAAVWAHDFMKDTTRRRPAAATPAARSLYNGTIIVTVGGPGQAIAAFNQQTGALVWKSRRFRRWRRRRRS